MTFYYDYNLRKIFRIDEDQLGRSTMGEILPLSFQFEPLEPEATHFRKCHEDEYLMIKTHKKRVTVIQILEHKTLEILGSFVFTIKGKIMDYQILMRSDGKHLLVMSDLGEFRSLHLYSNETKMCIECDVWLSGSEITSNRFTHEQSKNLCMFSAYDIEKRCTNRLVLVKLIPA
jgi:hypothetical protein